MISDHRSLRWPHWRDVLEIWNPVRPPDVQIIPFVIDEHSPNDPWFNRRAPYETLSSSPQVTTARHLCRVPPECLDAFKIYACCRERDAIWFNRNVIEPVFRAHGLGGKMFWTAGAKYLLPQLSGDFVSVGTSLRHDEAAQRAGWRALVTEAAERWAAVANEWALVRIPKFMDSASAEYAEWRRFDAAQKTLDEREQYERLKRKFERQ